MPPRREPSACCWPTTAAVTRRPAILWLRHPRRHDLRPGRGADSPGGRGLGRPRSLPRHRRRARRGGDDLARRADELLLRRAHGLRPQAEAGHLGAWRADHLVHRRRVRGRPVRDPRRDELLGAAHRRRGRAAAPAASAVDAAAGEVGAHVDCRARLGRHEPHGRSAGADPGRRARQSRGGRRAADLHESSVDRARRPARSRPALPAGRSSSRSATPAAAAARGRSPSSRRPRLRA